MLAYGTPRPFLICVRQLSDRYIDGASFSGGMNRSTPPGLRILLCMDIFYNTHMIEKPISFNLYTSKVAQSITGSP